MSRPFWLVALAAILAAQPGQPMLAADAAVKKDARAKNADALREYAKEIRLIRAELDQGKAEDSKTRLLVTDESQRSFEHAYLTARAAASVVDGKSPDLIQTVTKPEEVETRYGVLNEVTLDLVFISRDGGLRIHNLRALDQLVRSVTHKDGSAVWRAHFTRDGKQFFSGHKNGEVVVWDAATWEPLHTVALGEDLPVRELAVAPDGSAFVAEAKTSLELWGLKDGKFEKIASVGERLRFGEGLAFSPTGDVLATGGMFDITLYNARTGTPGHTMRHASYTMGLEFSPDGQFIASAPRGNVNKFLAVFDRQGAEPLFNAGPFGHYVAGMAFTPDGKRIAATGCEKLLRLFDATTGEVVLSWDRPDCGAQPAFSRDGRLLGWFEPDGYKFIDLGPATDGKP